VILVTGATGNVGCEAVMQLLDEGSACRRGHPHAGNRRDTGSRPRDGARRPARGDSDRLLWSLAGLRPSGRAAHRHRGTPPGPPALTYAEWAAEHAAAFRN